MTRLRADRAPSFAWRLFGVTALSVGLAIGLVLWIGWQGLMARERDRLDERLCMEGRRLVAMAPVDFASERWERLGPDLALKLRLPGPDFLRARVSGAAGSVSWASPGDWPGGALPGPDRDGPGGAAAPDPRGSCRWARRDAGGRPWQSVSVRSGGRLAELAADQTGLAADLRADLRHALLWIVPIGVALAMLTAWLLALLTLRPLRQLREAMRRVDQHALDARLPMDGQDREFRELIAAYNTMLARLEASFHQASRFSADAAHELRTPLTILRGRLEQAIAHSEGRAVQVELGQIQDEVERLVSITRKLLLLAQADAGRLALQRQPVDLSELLHDLMADARMLDETRTLQADIAPGLRVLADETLLRQALNNLVSNACRYGGEPGWVRVQAVAEAGGVAVLLANDCEPLDAGQRERFFERFFRADAAHNRRKDGTGLGLSLVREIVRAHGGQVALRDSPADEVHLRLWLPAA